MRFSLTTISILTIFVIMGTSGQGVASEVKANHISLPLTRQKLCVDSLRTLFTLASCNNQPLAKARILSSCIIAPHTAWQKSACTH